MTPLKGNSVTKTQERPASGVWGMAPYPVIEAHADGTVIEINPAASHLLAGALPGATMADLAPAWLARAHHEAVLRTTLPAQDSRHSGPLPSVSGQIEAQSFVAHPTRGRDGNVVWWLIEDTDRRLAEEALASERERTTFLSEASNVLLASLNSDRCMTATAQLASQYLADAAVVVAPARGHKLPVAHATAGQEAIRSLIVADPSQLPGLKEALQGFPPVPSRWLDPRTLPEWVTPPGHAGEIGSVVITPLPGHGVPAGALILLRGSGQFTENEEIFARLFAARAGAALSAARMYAEQTEITKTLMRDLLPPQLHRINGVEFAGGYRPAGATERVGGDFYDVHPGSTDTGASLVVLGDVCGKGLDAAVLTGKIRNTLHALVPMADDHQRMLQLLNGALLNSHHARFATMVMASVQRSDKTVRLRLTSAGHPPPLVVRADGRVDEIQTHGTLIGALPLVESHTVETTLQPGETCLLYTDGITEARGGPLGDDLYGEERLMEALSECANMPSEAVVEHIQMLASQWLREGRHDDMAVVAITAPLTNHLSAVNGHTRGRYTA
ncbi:SpoIIE family protein phosphatase [Streptomyces sp. OR43]|uniref:SpoIIE family protein phosphatase n=1 Tax=Streptomyces sp. or43 TaxID=2478957 RepID=UPI0011CE1F76|nr:serine/threonine protein phosphatase [Streptomyces sp. or43]